MIQPQTCILTFFKLTSVGYPLTSHVYFHSRWTASDRIPKIQVVERLESLKDEAEKIDWGNRKCKDVDEVEIDINENNKQ